MLGHSTRWTLCALALMAGCGTARLDEDPAAQAGPDAGAEETLLGCVVTITYPPSSSNRAMDVLTYDATSRLQKHERHLSDGLVDVREWTWSEGGYKAKRNWFDGSSVVVLDGSRRIMAVTTYEADGSPSWLDALTYDDDGRLSSRVMTRLADESPWIETTYAYDGSVIQQMRETRVAKPEEVRTVSYKYTEQDGGTRMVQSVDVEGDGHVDFKTAVLIAENGTIIRGVDAQGGIVEYEYDGSQCGAAARSWTHADPFFVDM